MWTVEMYETESGETPIEDFLLSLDKKMLAKATTEIGILKENGRNMRGPYSKHMKNGIFELRIQVADNISRVFYFFYVGNKIILTNGFIKKTQKTPPRELERALKYKQEYERRMRQNAKL